LPSVLNVLYEYYELIPAHSREAITRSQHACHRRTNAPQQVVACLMPAGVVDKLELVQVDVDNSDLTSANASALLSLQ
jgi:hypothetical protein